MSAAVIEQQSWSLSVKAIGSTLKECKNGSTASSSSSSSSDASAASTSKSSSRDNDSGFTGEANFQVQVSPEDTLECLYSQIEQATGLKAAQQRLIYRGRILPRNDDHYCDTKGEACPADDNDDEKEDNDEKPSATPKTNEATTAATAAATASSTEKKVTDAKKIKDIVGLGDGHTIHLVKRQESVADPATATSSTTNAFESATTTTAADSDESLSGIGTASLLAALMGLSGADEDNDGTTTTTTASRQRWRSTRRSRRPHYRLTAEDLTVPDPGTLEPVRQSLMTIHTLLPHAQHPATTSPLEANRRWYRGQWLDVRDTVNQWLEATVVVVMNPEDILPPGSDQWQAAAAAAAVQEEDEAANSAGASILEPVTDPAVHAIDYEGRRRLLLEPCEEGDAGDLGGGFRPRRSNRNVQLLLIHYNGWPHRWDEWIRSDSERIRPFRTRTRHPSMVRTFFLADVFIVYCEGGVPFFSILITFTSLYLCAITIQATYSSPTTQSAFNDSPPTFIAHEDHGMERPAILPELSRVVTAIDELLREVAADEAAQVITEQQQIDLPWAVRIPDSSDEEEDAERDSDDDDVYKEDDDDEALPPLVADEPSEDAAQVNDTSSPSTRHGNRKDSQLRRRQLQLLAPLLDRLGRTLVDVAPHVAALANDNTEENNEGSVSSAEAVGTSEPVEDHHSTLGGLLSLLSRDRRRQRNSSRDHGNGETEEAEVSNNENNNLTWPVDPDYVDFATGAVNTTRGEVRSGPRSRSSNDDIAGLLGAYLAAASLGLNTGGGGGGGGGSGDNDDASNILGLGRVLRGNGGGNGGPGIDIHIHAVLTAPGMPPTPVGGGAGLGGGLGIAALGVGGGATPATTRTPSTPPSRRGLSSLRHRAPSPVVGEDDGLFSDLYSESPDPVDPNGSPELSSQARREERTNTLDDDFLARLTHPSSGSPSTPRRHASSTPPRNSRQNGQTPDSASSRRNSTSRSSSRRGSMFGRLFRRSRRSSNRDF